MKIKFKHEQTWDGHNFQVQLNGKKFPKERGAWYTPSLENVKAASEKALVWAMAENNGLYVSRDGEIFNSKEDYDKTFWERFYE